MKLLHGTYLRIAAVASIMMLAMPFVTLAQTKIQKHEPVKVYFRQGSSTLDPRHINNAAQLEELSKLLESYVVDSIKAVGHVHILSSASPEGSINTNQRLVEGRAKAIANWVSKRFNIEVGYKVEEMGIDWETLTTLVEQNSNVPAREELLDILRDTSITDVYVRRAKLEALHGGEPYQYIYTYLFPKMRYAAVAAELWYASEIRFTTPDKFYFGPEGGEDVVRFVKDVEDKVVPAIRCNEPWITDIVPTANSVTFRVAPNTATEPRQGVINLDIYGKTYPVHVYQKAAEPVVVPEPEPEPEPEPVVEEPVCKNDLFMSISNNGLYDLALIPNIGVEFYLGKDWSIDANWHYAWWKTDKRHRYWRTYGGDINIRKWFGKASKIKPLTGHHVGLYGQMITYDFELGGRGYLADKWSWAAGVEYGYSLPIARRLNLDFAIGVGYHWGEYKEYLPIDNCYVWQETNNRKYIGPTKVEVSLIWLIGCDNYNKEKGGKK